MSSHLPTARTMTTVAMDPSLANDVGLHHTVGTAVADLVDNSVDAHARAVLVRLLLDGERPVGLQVVDDGRGMDRADLERALTYAGTKEYGEDALGHFGVGLKAASLSQADVTVVCSAKYGATPVGARLERTGERQAPRTGALETDDVTNLLAECGIGEGRNGTVVQWDSVRTFTSSGDPEEQRRWVTQTMDEVGRELGLLFHRIIASGRCAITLEVVDVNTGFAGAPRVVEAVDPFGYPRSGHSAYPQPLEVTLTDGSRPVEAEVHVWPARSQSPSFKLGGRPGVDTQGFFVYRNDRLLQVGGWSGIRGPRPEWELARVKIDLTNEAKRHVQINPEKSGVTFTDDLRRALELSRTATTGATFAEYLDASAGTEKDARRRTRRPVKAVPPGTGLAGPVRAAFEEALTLEDTDPVEIRWKILDPDEFFRVDREENTLWINLRHRATLTGKAKSSNLDDVPVLKTLLHLLVTDFFTGAYPGAREKLQIEAWNAVLTTAALVQKGDR